MEKPKFLSTAITCLLLDIFFMVAVLFIGLPAILGVMILVPVLASFGIQSVLMWSRSRVEDKSVWGGLANLQCAASLLFLLLTLVINQLPPPEQGDIFTVLAFIYILLWAIRFFYAANVMFYAAPICFILARAKQARFACASALLCSWCGIQVMKRTGEQDPEMLSVMSSVITSGSAGNEKFFMFLLYSSNFGFALMWGGVLLYLAGKFKQQ